MCVRHGVDVIYHASYIDDEGMDMLEAKKDKHIVAPGINWLIATRAYSSSIRVDRISPELTNASQSTMLQLTDILTQRRKKSATGRNSMQRCVVSARCTAVE